MSFHFIVRVKSSKKLNVAKSIKCQLALFIGKAILICFALTSFNQVACAQIKLSLSIESGLNSSGMPRSEWWPLNKGLKHVEKDRPIIRPLVGIWSKINIKKHFYIGSGMQYHTTGVRSNVDVNSADKLSYSYTRNNFNFRRISFPIVIGYSFRIKKTAMSFFIGKRPFTFITGSYVYKYKSVYPALKIDDYFEVKLDPFDPRHHVSAQKKQKQYCAGVDIKLKDKISVSISYAATRTQAYFSENIDNYTAPLAGNGHHQFSKSDYAITLRYVLLDVTLMKAKKM
jgi:hypothetical protein